MLAGPSSPGVPGRGRRSPLPLTTPSTVRLTRNTARDARRRSVVLDFAALSQAIGTDQQRQLVDSEFAFQRPPGQTQPSLLGCKGNHLTGLRAAVFELPDVLQMMNHLVHEYREVGETYACPSFRQVDGPVRVVVNRNKFAHAGQR